MLSQHVTSLFYKQ